MTIDVLYLARNRRAFTEFTFGLLLANTDWSLVDRLVVYDDGSTDGTRGWLHRACHEQPRVEFRRTNLRSPVNIMLDYLATTDADVFAKIDNDIAVPPGWLNAAAPIMEHGPDLLGLAAGWTGVTAGVPGWSRASHIGGVGLMRVEAFKRHPGLWGNGRQGFTQWQHATKVVSGWITPDLPVPQLDLIPAEPWRTLARKYVAKGWAREWPPYAEASQEWWSWFPSP